MHNWVDVILVLVLLANLILLGSSRLVIYIRVIAFQSLILGVLPTLLHAEQLSRVLFLALMSGVLKGIVLPLVLLYVFKAVKVYREIEPFVGYGFSLVLGATVFALSFWLGYRLPIVTPVATPLMLPTALSTIFIGLFLIVSRKKAFTQILGYLTFENGIYILGIALVGDVPAIVELGVLLDLFVAVLIMAVATHRINRQFEHVDAEKLDFLKG